MRILLLLCISISAFSQKTKQFPFQVFSAERCSNKKNEVVKSRDFLKSNDVIKLTAGEIYLIHNSGFTFHIKGDTILVLSKISNLLDSLPAIERPNLNHIFSEEYFLNMVHDFDSKIIYPPTRSAVHNKQLDLCLKWKPGKNDGYKIRLTDIFSDTVAVLKTNTNSITIPTEQIQAMKLDLDVLLVEIVYQDKSENGNKLRLKFFENNFIGTPYSCEFNNALQTLLTGYWLEDMSLTTEAEEYFRVAALMAPAKPFQEALGYYFKRKAKFYK